MTPASSRPATLEMTAATTAATPAIQSRERIRAAMARPRPRRAPPRVRAIETTANTNPSGPRMTANAMARAAKTSNGR
jgi:hypothetical protein